MVNVCNQTSQLIYVPDSRFRFDAILGCCCCCCCCDCCCNMSQNVSQCKWVGFVWNVLTMNLSKTIFFIQKRVVCVYVVCNYFFLYCCCLSRCFATQKVVNERIEIRTFHLLFTFSLHLTFYHFIHKIFLSSLCVFCFVSFIYIFFSYRHII